MGELGLIEMLYWEARNRGGQKAQLGFDLRTDELADAFAATAGDVANLNARGPFYPAATRKSLLTLARERANDDEIRDTEHVQSLLGRPPRWEVAGDQSLDFEFVARELTPMSAVTAGQRVWLTPNSDRRISLDALLVNADDRTPVVAEIKVGADENAELGLIQALVAAAQLSSASQRARLFRQYRDFFDAPAPADRLDVYVITARAPERGVRPQLAARARERADELIASGAISQWVRRIGFINMTLIGGCPTFTTAVAAGAEE